MIYGGIALIIIWSVYVIASIGLISQFEFSFAADVLSQTYLISVIKFTFLQAFLSTLISIGMAIPIARALHRQNFIGKQLILIISGLCLVIPVIVAVLGIVAVHGGKGWIASAFDIEVNYLYSLIGILIAHVFFNLPLAVRVLLHSLYTVPESSWRLASHLGMNSWHIFKLLEWPLFRNQLPATSGLIFLLCFTSFAVVLVFGGGLKYSTLEVAIYQALRFDFNISAAVVLAAVQILVCLMLFLTMIRFSRRFALQDLSVRPVFRHDGQTLSNKLIDYTVLSVFALWIILPILAILTGSITTSGWSVVKNESFYKAVVGSICVSLASGLLASVFVISLGYLSKQFTYSSNRSKYKMGILEVSVQLSLIFPAFVLATGLFVVLKKHAAVAGPIIVIVINVLAILPFMVRIFLPAMLATYKHDHLAKALGITGLNRFRLIDWPILRTSFAWALGIGLALSLGDFSVIALFGTQDFVTLPLYLYRLMGAYKIDQATVVGVLICILCLATFYSCNRYIGRIRKS